MHKKIKILRIIARLNIGGPAIHTILLSQGLNNDKFDSVLISGITENNEADMLYLAEKKGVKPLFIPELGRTLSLKRDLIAFWKIFQLIKEERPDIIHTHTAKAGTLGRLAGIVYNFTQYPPTPRLRRTGAQRNTHHVKLIHTFHGHVLYSYFGGFKTRVFIWIERILAKFTDSIIAVSNEVKRELLNLKIGSPNKVIVMPLGLELDGLLTLSENRNSQVNIGLIGRLTPIKNHLMFFNAVRLLQECAFMSSVKFIIVGDGELRESLEEKVKDLGINKYIEFRGWQRNLEDLYSNLDIVALTSLNEGTPVSLIEAMAAARPVVATNVGGVKDLVNEKRGLLVESNDVVGLASALRALIANEQLRRELGNSGRDFVRDRFTKERLIKDIQGLYDDLLKEKQK